MEFDANSSPNATPDPVILLQNPFFRVGNEVSFEQRSPENKGDVIEMVSSRPIEDEIAE